MPRLTLVFHFIIFPRNSAQLTVVNSSLMRTYWLLSWLASGYACGTGTLQKRCPFRVSPQGIRWHFVQWLGTATVLTWLWWPHHLKGSLAPLWLSSHLLEPLGDPAEILFPTNISSGLVTLETVKGDLLAVTLSGQNTFCCDTALSFFPCYFWPREFF